MAEVVLVANFEVLLAHSRFHQPYWSFRKLQTAAILSLFPVLRSSRIRMRLSFREKLRRVGAACGCLHLRRLDDDGHHHHHHHHECRYCVCSLRYNVEFCLKMILHSSLMVFY